MKKTLKFLSWMFVAVLSVLSFSSCSDDDEGHPYAGTVWEYEDIYESGTITTRIRFADETKAYYEVEQRNAGGTIVDNTSSPYSLTQMEGDPLGTRTLVLLSTNCPPSVCTPDDRSSLEGDSPVCHTWFCDGHLVHGLTNRNHST